MQQENAVQYPEVKEHIEEETGKSIFPSNGTKNWHDLGHTSKKVKRVLEKVRLLIVFALSYSLGTRDFDERFRSKCQRVNKNRLVFIDGTGMRSEPRKLRAISPRGTTPRAEQKNTKNMNHE